MIKAIVRITHIEICCDYCGETARDSVGRDVGSVIDHLILKGWEINGYNEGCSSICPDCKSHS